MSRRSGAGRWSSHALCDTTTQQGAGPGGTGGGQEGTGGDRQWAQTAGSGRQSGPSGLHSPLFCLMPYNHITGAICQLGLPYRPSRVIVSDVFASHFTQCGGWL